MPTLWRVVRRVALGHLVAVFLPVLIPRAFCATEALLVVVGDQHSAYERTAQFVARVDRIKEANPGIPLAILINGDSLEYGNVVARRTSGAIDFAMFAALARRAPTVINLGNHEPEFHDVPEMVRLLREAGLVVISGNLRDRATGKPYAPPSALLRLGAHDLVIAGVTTDRLATYRVALRPKLDLADPVVWARENLHALFGQAVLPVVLSHAGVRADREILSMVPEGTLFAGAHDHLRFVHEAGRTVYFHSGSWMEYLSVARLDRTRDGLRWSVMQERIPDSSADRELARMIRETLGRHLTPEESVVVGKCPRALGPEEAAMFAVEAVRAAAGADAALVGGTTFGAGVPAGDVTRYALDAWVRFDGPIFEAEVDGGWLMALMARCNQGETTPLAARTGERLVAAARSAMEAGRRYRFATTDWVAKNARQYLGDNPPALTEVKGLRLKATVVGALHH